MLKVLFLDIDGVVLAGEDWGHDKGNRYLPPAKIALVKEVCERTGAQIVVSSTWRYSPETLSLLRHAGLNNIHAEWRTDSEARVGGIYVGEVRGAQIQRWLEAFPETCAYAIVDDDSDMLPDQKPQFVKTPHETGIGREHVEALVAILSRPPAPAVLPIDGEEGK